MALIERLVLNGGGAKGIGYPGVCQALHDAGVFVDARSISGASIGAIFAAMLAVGTEPGVLRKKMIDHNLADLIANHAFLGPNIVPVLTMSLDNVERFLNQHLISTTSDFLEKQKILPQKMQIFLQDILKEGHQLSFDELYTLHTVYPKQFKALTVVAVAMGRYHLTVFNHQESTKNISIARACVASSAWPVIFQPIKINGIYYQDGGLVDPLPSEYFVSNNSDESPGEKFKKTLLFVFYFSFFNDAINKKKVMTSLVKSALMVGNFLLTPLVNVPFFLINFTFFLIKCVIYLLFIIPYLLACLKLSQIKTEFTELSNVFFSLFVLPVAFDLVTVANSLFTRISEQYSDRTILLHPGNIGSNNFKIEPMTARTMHALYYLETMEHIMKYKLHDGSFIIDEKTFYQKVLMNFNRFYTPSKSDSSIELDDFKYKLKNKYLQIKKIANESHHSPTALALTKATEQLYKNLHPIRPEEQYTSKDRFFTSGSPETAFSQSLLAPIDLTMIQSI